MEYHKIETLYERNPATFKVNVGEYKNRTYSLLKQWRWTEKIDGTNIRVMWTPDGKIRTDSKGEVEFGGRSDNAQIHADLYKHLQQTFPVEKLAVVFPTLSAVLYGEGFGAGIQKVGGAYSETKSFILFDVLVDGTWWLSHENVKDVADKLGIQMGA